MASARLASFISRTITAVSPARVGGLTAIKRRSRSRLNRWNGNESERLESRALLVNSISVFAEVPQAYESNQAPGLFTIHRDGDLTYGLLVNIGLDGFENNETTVATNGVDYNFVGPQVFFSPGISDVSISIVPILDSIVESESAVLVVIPGTGEYVSGASASVLIIDATVPPVQDFGQHNNYEDACGCGSLPPGTDVDGGQVGQGNGDFLLPFKNLVSTAASALSSYMFPTSVSGGDSQISVDATISLPATPSSVTVDVEVRNSSGAVVGTTTFNPSATALPPNQNGTMSLSIDPAALKNSAGATVPALITGNYTINATVRAILPGTTPVTVTNGVVQANFAFLRP